MAKSHSRSRSNSRSPHSRSRRSRSSRSRSRSHNKNSKSLRNHRSLRRRSASKSPACVKFPVSGSTSSVLDACWKPVRHDPTNFDAWTHLLQCVENLDDVKSAKDAFDPFLAKFPYCFGYWRKYAEFFKKHKKMDAAAEVYERGVEAVPLSVDLWLAYLTYYKEYVKDLPDSTKKIVELYEKAIEAAGLEFRSDKLWEDYVNWRLSKEDFAAATNVYDRMIRVPLLLYSAHFDKLQDFVNTYEPHEVLSEEEFDRMYKDIESKLVEKGQDIFVAEDSAENHIKLKPDPDADNENDEQPVVIRKKYSEEALKMFRIAILDKRRKVHLKTESEVSKRWSFEEAIKRPYFHVKPLERTQLRNWRHYLDFEIEQGDKKRIVVLFERCLIACALYEDIWVRYARYMESVDAFEVRHIFKRACETHLVNKASMHLLWAAFEEKQKNYDYARSILANFEADHPGSIVVLLRRAGIEVRRAMDQARHGDGDGDGANPDFTTVCKEFEKLIADAKSNKIATFFATKYARFHEKIRKDQKMAEKIVLDAIRRDANNSQLYMHLVQLAYEQQPFDVDCVSLALDQALASGLPDAEKLQFSQRKLELLEDFGHDVDHIQRHYEAHIKLYKSLGFATSKKRPPAANATAQTDDKRAKLDVPITPTLANPAAYAAAGGSAYYDYYYSQQQQGAAAGSVVTYQPPPSAGGAAYAPQQHTYGYYVSNAAATASAQH